MLPEQTGTFTLDEIGLTADQIEKIFVDPDISATIEGNTVTVVKGSTWEGRAVKFLTTSDELIHVSFNKPNLYICVNGALPNRLTSSNPVGTVMANRFHTFNVSFAYNAEWVDLEKENDANCMYSVLRELSSNYFGAFTITEMTLKQKDEYKPTDAAAALAGTQFTKIGDSYRISTVFDDSILLTPPAPGAEVSYLLRYTISITLNDGTVLQGAWSNQVVK